MSNSFSSITVHIIFHTKSTGCMMTEEDLPRIFHYIGGVIHALSGYVYTVGGRPDHIHILTSLPVTTSVADFVGKIKSNTSRWLKEIGPSYKNFSWQEGYGVFSVSESNRDKVISYISKQKEHHLKSSTQEEFRRFLFKHGISVGEDC